MAIPRKTKDDQSPNRNLSIEFVRAALQNGAITFIGNEGSSTEAESVQRGRQDALYLASLVRQIRLRLDSQDKADALREESGA